MEHILELENITGIQLDPLIFNLFNLCFNTSVCVDFMDFKLKNSSAQQLISFWTELQCKNFQKQRKKGIKWGIYDLSLMICQQNWNILCQVTRSSEFQPSPVGLRASSKGLSDEERSSFILRVESLHSHLPAEYPGHINTNLLCFSVIFFNWLLEYLLS